MNGECHGLRGSQRPPESSSRQDKVVEGGGEMQKHSRFAGWRAGGGAAPGKSTLGFHAERWRRAPGTSDHHKGDGFFHVGTRRSQIVFAGAQTLNDVTKMPPRLPVWDLFEAFHWHPWCPRYDLSSCLRSLIILEFLSTEIVISPAATLATTSVYRT